MEKWNCHFVEGQQCTELSKSGAKQCISLPEPIKMKNYVQYYLMLDQIFVYNSSRSIVIVTKRKELYFIQECQLT